jgi:hypothetical protein
MLRNILANILRWSRAAEPLRSPELNDPTDAPAAREAYVIYFIDRAMFDDPATYKASAALPAPASLRYE